MIVLGILCGILLLALVGVIAYFLAERQKLNRLGISLSGIQEKIKQLTDKSAALVDSVGTIEERRMSLAAEVEKYSNMLTKARHELDIARTENDTLRAGYADKLQALQDNYAYRFSALELEFQKRVDEGNHSIESLKEQRKQEYNAIIENFHKDIEEQHQILLAATEQNRIDSLDDLDHMLNLGSLDEAEIAELMEVCRRLRNPLPLCKAIYEVYYRTPLATMVNNLQVKGVSGIYKLTDLTNNKVYIGKSVDIGERWKQHVKRGCGAELGTVSGSKLYGAMNQNGLWNFRFEVLQECGKDDLNKLEKYWISYFSSVEYGYNMKAGG